MGYLFKCRLNKEEETFLESVRSLMHMFKLPTTNDFIIKLGLETLGKRLAQEYQRNEQQRNGKGNKSNIYVPNSTTRTASNCEKVRAAAGTGQASSETKGN